MFVPCVLAAWIVVATDERSKLPVAFPEFAAAIGTLVLLRRDGIVFRLVRLTFYVLLRSREGKIETFYALIAHDLVHINRAR